MKNYLKESLLSLLCFIIHGQGSSEKGFKILNCETEIYLTAVVSCLHARNWNRKGFLPLISNILFQYILHWIRFLWHFSFKWTSQNKAF